MALLSRCFRRNAVALGLLLGAKVALGLYLADATDCLTPGHREGRLAIAGGDTPSYLEPAERLLAEGRYSWFNGRREVLAGRMPYYGLAYLAVRTWNRAPQAKDLLVLAQLATECAALLVLADLAGRLAGTTAGWWVVVILGGASTQWTHYSYRLVPESLSLACLSFFLAAYVRFRSSGSKGALVVAGCALAVGTGLKPYLILVLLPLGLDLGKDGVRASRTWRGILGAAALLLLPLVLLLGPWTIRNAFLYGQFMPLQVNSYAGYDFDETYFAYRRFLSAWGGSSQWWDKRSAGCYFEPRPGYACVFEMPREAFAPGYGRDEVERARSLFLRSNSDPSLRQAAREAFEHLTTVYREQQPFRYHVLAPLSLVSQMVFHSGSYYLPVRWDSPCYSPAQGLLKWTQSLAYYLVLACGTGGLLIWTARGQLPLVFLGVPLLLAGLFGWVMRLPEFRYFDLAFPILLVGTAVLVSEVIVARSRRTAPRGIPAEPS